MAIYWKDIAKTGDELPPTQDILWDFWVENRQADEARKHGRDVPTLVPRRLPLRPEPVVSQPAASLPPRVRTLSALKLPPDVFGVPSRRALEEAAALEVLLRQVSAPRPADLRVALSPPPGRSSSSTSTIPDVEAETVFSLAPPSRTPSLRRQRVFPRGGPEFSD